MLNDNIISILALLAMIRNDEAINVIEFVMNTFQKTDSKTLAEMMNQQHPEKLYQMNKAIRKDMLLSKVMFKKKELHILSFIAGTYKLIQFFTTEFSKIEISKYLKILF